MDVIDKLRKAAEYADAVAARHSRQGLRITISVTVAGVRVHAAISKPTAFEVIQTSTVSPWALFERASFHVILPGEIDRCVSDVMGRLSEG